MLNIDRFLYNSHNWKNYFMCLLSNFIVEIWTIFRLQMLPQSQSLNENCPIYATFNNLKKMLNIYWFLYNSYDWKNYFWCMLSNFIVEIWTIFRLQMLPQSQPLNESCPINATFNNLKKMLIINRFLYNSHNWKNYVRCLLSNFIVDIWRHFRLKMPSQSQPSSASGGGHTFVTFNYF